MKHKHLFWNLGVILLLVTNLPLVRPQEPCPLGVFIVTITGPDAAPADVPLLAIDYNTDKIISSTEIIDEDTNRFLEAGYQLLEPEKYSVTFSPLQPAFGEALDYEGKAEVRLNEGLQINYEGGSYAQCGIILRITDTNNRAPAFNRTDDLEFDITPTWDPTVPINWNDRFEITDYDSSVTSGMVIQVTSSSGGKLRGEASFSGTTPDGFGNMFDVLLYVEEVPPLGPNEFTITPSDGDNIGEASLTVRINVDYEDNHEPFFKSEEYFVTWGDKMPEAGESVDLEVVVYDPDDKITGGTSTYDFKVEEDSDREFIDFNGDDKLEFLKEVDNRAGETISVNILAVQDGTAKVARAVVKIKLPSPVPKFGGNVFTQNIAYWPAADEEIPIDNLAEPVDPGQEPMYELGDSKLPDEFIKLEGGRLKFVQNMDPTKLGALQDNRVVMFDLKAYDPRYKAYSVASYVITFPTEDPPSTTDSTTGTTEFASTDVTGDSTTETGCPICSTTDNPVTCPSTPDPGDCDCSTGNTTPDSGGTTPDGSTDGTTPDDSSDGTTPGGTTPDCPPPITCPPPCDCSTTEPPPDCSTGNPITSETECPPCLPTTENPSSDPPECTPCDCSTDSTSWTTNPPFSTCPPPEPPCDCSTTLAPPDCSTGDPTTSQTECPPCTTDNPVNPPCSSEPPCDCDSPTTCPPPIDCPSTDSPATCPPPIVCPPPDDCTTTPQSCPPCPCDQDGDDEDDDCSNTGLVVAVITTSVLCAASIGALGISLLYLRKAKMDPTRISHKESLLFSPSDMESPIISQEVPPSTSPPPTTTTFNRRVSFADEAPTPNRFNRSSITAPAPEFSGFTNPNFTPDPEPGTTSTSTPVTSPVPVVTPEPSPSETYSQPAAKKSNIKPPKEIEPDYEEVPEQKTPEARKISQGAGVSDTETKPRVLFAPEDEYAVYDVIGSDAGGGTGGGDVGGDPEGGEEPSDIEDERL